MGARKTVIYYRLDFWAAVVVVVFAAACTAMRSFDALPPFFVVSAGIDLFGMGILLVLLWAVLIDISRGGEIQPAYLRMVYATIFYAYFDLMAYLVDSLPGSRAAVIVTNTGLYAFSVLLSYLFWDYVLALMDVEPGPHIRALTRFWQAGVILNIILLLLNMKMGFFFTVDANGVYERAGLYKFSMILTYLIQLTTVIMIIVRRRKLKGYQVLCLLCYVFTPLAGSLITDVYYGLSVGAGIIFLNMLIIYCVIHVEEQKKTAAVQNELAVANRIQSSLLPQTFPAYPERDEFGIHASMTTAKEVGGDFYDFFFVDDDHFAIVIGDVSGKGMPGALFMTISRTLIKNRTQMGGDPADILRDVGRILDEDNPSALFVTVWLGIIEVSTGLMHYCSGGHDYPVVGVRGGAYSFLRKKNSPAVALFPELPFVSYRYKFFENERILLYTDGLPEALNTAEEQYGFERILAVCEAHTEESDEALLQAIQRDVEAYTIGMEPFDDMTLLSFTYHGKGGKRS